VLETLLCFLVALRVFLRSRSDTALEVLALRQQIAVLKRKQPRPRLNYWDRVFWTTLRQCWSRWTDVLVLVKPDTVVGWHRAGLSDPTIGAREPGLGAQDSRRTSEARFRCLGAECGAVSAPCAASWRPWQELANVLTESSRSNCRVRLLYGADGDIPATLLLFVIEHGRRRILHFNVTDHLTAGWVVQQLREAFPKRVRIDMPSSIEIRRSTRKWSPSWRPLD
jgi:putative transposase